jgi:hypothetical protein
MPIQIQWGDPQQASIQINFTESFDLDSWYKTITEVSMMLNSKQHPVDIILDLTKFDRLPMQLIDALNSSKPRFHDNQYAQIAVVQHPLLNPMRTLLNETDMLRGTAVVASLIEAYQMPDQMRTVA